MFEIILYSLLLIGAISLLLSLLVGASVIALFFVRVRFLIEGEKKLAQATGFEVSPWAYLKARLNIYLSKSQARIIYKNFYSVSLENADVIFCFLLDTVMPR